MMPNDLFGGKLGFQQGFQQGGQSMPPAPLWGQSAAPQGTASAGYVTKPDYYSQQQPGYQTHDPSLSGGPTQPANPFSGDMSGAIRPNGPIQGGYDPNQSTAVPVGSPGVSGPPITTDPMGGRFDGNMGLPPRPFNGGLIQPAIGGGAGAFTPGGGRMYGVDPRQQTDFTKGGWQTPQYNGGGYNNFINGGFGGNLKRWGGGY
jgi:hypothetical protein